MADPVLKVRNLDMHFPIGGSFFGKQTDVVRAVDKISFDVFRGESFGIVGESGSGKTTLGRCIMRTLDPSAGSIKLTTKTRPEAELIGASRAEMTAIWRDMRMVFQDPQSSLNPRLRVLDLVGQALQKSEGLKGQALADRVGDLLEQVGLQRAFLMRYPNAFSGGQRQRLGIARALATKPEIVIADEAVSALDVSIQAQTLNLMQDLQEDYDLTYIFIAHDLAVVEHFCDRVAVMYLGQIVELADRDTLFRAPKHPYTKALLDAVPRPVPKARSAKRVAPIGKVSDRVSTGCKFAPRCPLAQDVCWSSEPSTLTLGSSQLKCHRPDAV
ncbi:ABC transporter ATP-binding protein [uncultured Pelagimonas sp.]|uniref:ABC transporter ATP-binding protein n=1 Tax=uncultured Pelagimonas sp. TaxID=1618102 RepID=UPI00260F82F7|nr:ABC transporter ATP-binding protein [uncultured Pelagimonas sp.]